MIARTTQIEAFRRVLAGIGSEDELIDDLTGKGRDSWQAEAGRAFHALLAEDDPPAKRFGMCQSKTDRGNVYESPALAEAAAWLVRNQAGAPVVAFRCATCDMWHIGKRTGKEDDLGIIANSGWSFERSAWADIRRHQGPGLREITAKRRVGPLTVSGTCDHVWGATVRDTKCKFSGWSSADYELSLQWRFYLLLHDCDCFTYDLVSFSEHNGFCEMRQLNSFRFWRYPQLENDCRAWAYRFYEWASERRLCA